MERTASPTAEHYAARSDKVPVDSLPTEDTLTFESLNRRLSSMPD